MRLTFLLPVYVSAPIGGYRVVYAYADVLAARGHRVTIVFLRGRRPPGGAASWLDSVAGWLWRLKIRLLNRPLVPWHRLHPGVAFALAPSARDDHIPDGDAVVATAWTTAGPVAALSRAKGAKFYLIQHHETWDGPAVEVDATWHLPLHKVVVSRWLLDVGRRLGASELRHIPNGIDLDRFRVTTPPADRRFGILSLYHRHAFKGVPDALSVLRRYHERFPDVPVTMFGAEPRGADVPDWIAYVADPGQDALVRDLYNGHTVYFGASLAEGFALPPAEAMACGCAFVGTDSGGCRDYATDGDTALLSPPGDRDGMLRDLTRITQDAALRARIQRRGTEAIRRFTWAAAGDALERYLAEHRLDDG